MSQSTLSPAQQALLKKRLAAGSLRATPVIPRRTGDEPAPLSFAQARFWLLNQIHPDLPLYQRPLVLRLKGSLSIEGLNMALSGLIARHAILRTRFPLREGQPVQEILPTSQVRLEAEEYADLDEATKNDILEREFAAIQAPFDLTSAPPVRWRLLRTGAAEHYLLVGMHHALFDGWSSVIFQEDLAALYAAAIGGTTPSLPALPVDYGDFAIWQHSEAYQAALEEPLRRWVKRFQGALPELDLPLKRPVGDGSKRETDKASNVACEILWIEPEQVRKLRNFAVKQDASLFMVLLAGYVLLLSRHTNQRELTVGSPVWGRGQVELEGMLGVFINPIPLPIRLVMTDTFKELVEKVRQISLECFADAQVPFEQIVEAVNPVRKAGSALLFQTLFQLRNLREPRLGECPLRIEEIKLPAVTEYDLAMEAIPTGEALRIELHFYPEVLGRRDAAALLAAYRCLLDHALATPATVIGDLPLVSATDRGRLLAQGQGGSASISLDCLATIARLAVEHPQSIAAQCGSDTLTRGQLSLQSEGIAHWLSDQGFGAGDRIGLALPRGTSSLSAMLGVLKAGAAFVWLDMDYPSERLAYMIRDSQVRLVMTADGISWGDEFGVPVVSAGQMLAGSTASHEPVLSLRLPDQPAYCIYTSGSTGQPKGILHRLAGLENAVTDAIGRYRLGEGDSILQVSPMGYDVALGDVFTALACGARLVIAPTEVVKDPARLLALVRDEAVTGVLSIVPTLLEALLNEAGEKGLVGTRLRLAVMVGEAPHAALCERYFQTAPVGALLYNRYGPSEATQATTLWKVNLAEGEDGALPVGQPLASARVYILDAGLQVVPEGLAGEVCIGGVHLARGYLNLRELSGERFVADPYQTGELLFRTGDRGYWNSAGQLVLIGRADNQIKLRGHRVELGEIEAILEKHPAVRRAAVIARSDQAGGARLEAFVVTRSGEPVAGGEMRSYLKRFLPEHMVPSAFIRLDELPITPHGKTDRRALVRTITEPQPCFDVGPDGDDGTGVKLARIWQQVLEIDSVPENVSFFDLGGYSMLVVGLMAKIRAAFGVQLMLLEFLDHPTLASQVRQLRAALPVHNGLLSVLSNPNGRLNLYLVHTIAGVATSYAPLLPHLPDALRVIGLEMPERWHESAPEDIPALAKLYCQAIFEDQPEGPYWICGWSFGGLVALEIAAQIERAGKQVSRLVVIDTDLSRLGDYTRCLRQDERIAHLVRKNWKLIRWVWERMREKTWPARWVYLCDLAARVARRITNGSRIERKVYAQELPTAVKANMRLNHDLQDTYRLPRFGGEVIVLRAIERMDVLEPRRLGWGAVADSVRVIDAPGDHNSIMSEPNVRTVGKIIWDALGS